MEPIEGEDGKRSVRMLRYICVSWVHSSATELPPPRSTQDMRPTSRMCRHVKVGVWGCVQEMVCAVSPLHYVFPRFPSTHRTNS